MKLNEVLAGREPLHKLSEKHFTNFKVARAIAGLTKEVEEETNFFNAEFKKLVDAYSEKDENGNPVVVQNGNIKLKDEEAKKAFDKEYAELLSLDVSDRVHKITVLETDFKTQDDFLTPAEMMTLDAVINWGEDTPVGALQA